MPGYSEKGGRCQVGAFRQLLPSIRLGCQGPPAHAWNEDMHMSMHLVHVSGLRIACASAFEAWPRLCVFVHAHVHASHRQRLLSSWRWSGLRQLAVAHAIANRTAVAPSSAQRPMQPHIRPACVHAYRWHRSPPHSYMCLSATADGLVLRILRILPSKVPHR